MIKKNKKFNFLEHTADIKFQSFGKSLEEVFKNSALALKEIISGKIKIKDSQTKKIEIQGRDIQSLLYNFLEEFLYLLDAENFLFNNVKEIKINSKKFKLTATLTGDSSEKYKFTNDIKAITYSEMFVKKEKKGYVCQVVVDV
ncbi:MAG: archease [Nanoarchaeota archaeon]|nr:archease [Nanoarchaeota archaeon]